MYADLTPSNSGLMVYPRKGTEIWVKYKYKFTITPTNAAPDRNLNTSPQLIFIN